MSIHAVGSVEAQVAEGLRSSPRRTPLAAARCLGSCVFREQAPWHHDQLLAASDSVEHAADLLDLAVTWGELDYSGEQLIDPGQWLRFLAAHRWPDHDLAARIFGLAEDVALRSGCATGRFTAACI